MIRAAALLLVAAVLPGCAQSSSPPLPAPGLAAPSAAPAVPAAGRSVGAPTWTPGDRWTYVWTSGNDQGRKTVEIREIKEINGVRYYVVRNAGADHYWTTDLHWAGSVRDAKVEARMVPPEPWYQWPLQAGQQWQHRGEYEQAGGKQRADDAFAVAGPENVEVPAGSFEAFKITRTGSSGDSDQYWYVPQVRSYVRWIGRRGTVQFEEKLSEYRVAGMPPAPTEAPVTPSTLR